MLHIVESALLASNVVVKGFLPKFCDEKNLTLVQTGTSTCLKSYRCLFLYLFDSWSH